MRPVLRLGLVMLLGCNAGAGLSARPAAEGRDEASGAIEPGEAASGSEQEEEATVGDDETGGEAAAVASRSCSGEWIEIGGGTNVLDEVRGAGVKADDFLPRYDAAAVDPARDRALKVTARYAVDERALLWIAGDAVVVDEAVFPDGLQVAEVTRMKAGEVARVGRIEAGALEALGVRKLTEFMLHARVIGAWIHIGARLCPLGGSPRREPDGRRVMTLGGTHTYFTNDENVEPITFAVEVAQDGLIEVRALEPNDLGAL